MKGTLITFEGPEGSGKTTQIKKLGEWLKGNKLPYIALREPGGTAIGEQIRNVLHDVQNKEMIGKTESLLYQAARAQIVAEKIRPALREGRIVLLDRFRESTVAYQGYARGLGAYQVDQLDFSTGGLSSDLILYFDVPVEVGLSRRLNNNDEFNRLDAEDIAFHKKVREAYLTLCKADLDDRWKYINADRGIEEIFCDVKKEVEAHLQKSSFIERPRITKER